MGDSYRPNRPARDSARLADRITFGDRPQNGGRSARNAEFNFSNGHPALQFPPSGPANGDNRARRQPRGRGGAHSGRDGRRGGDYAPSHGGSRNNAHASYRGRYKKPAPHERALLQTRDDTIEQPLGVSKGPNKFRNIADMSDDEEADMEIDSDRSGGDAIDNAKKHKNARKQSTAPANGNSVPKWSNPDPYTALPPPDETTGKRMDVVSLIRKAKIEAAEQAEASNPVAANDDFISFGDAGDGALSGAQPVVGSLNDVTASGTLSATSRDARRPVPDARLPQRPQNIERPAKRKRESPSGITDEWKAQHGQHPAPWAQGKGSDKSHLAKEPERWLHNEMLDFYESVAPVKHEEELRRKLIRRVEDAIGPAYFRHRASVQCFGSFPAGLYLPTADMDLVYTSDHHLNGGPPAFVPAKRDLWKISKLLTSRGIAIHTQVIPSAKVPIVKFTDKDTELPVDISFENVGGIHAQSYFMQWKEELDKMIYLVAFVKQFLVMRGWNEVSSGGLGGFSVICLVVSYLRSEAQDDHHIGDVVLGFLDYYGNQFDLNTTRIVMKKPYYRRKGSIGIDGRPENKNRLSIQDPNRPDNNISGGSHLVQKIFEGFSEAHAALVDRMNAVRLGIEKESILEAVIGGNYEAYQEHRRHMRRLASQGSRR